MKMSVAFSAVCAALFSLSLLCRNSSLWRFAARTRGWTQQRIFDAGKKGVFHKSPSSGRWLLFWFQKKRSEYPNLKTF